MIRTTCKAVFEDSGDTLTIVLKGEIDHHGAAGVREEIDACLYRTRPKVAVLDLSGIDFMDSSGLGLIMGRYALQKELGGKLVVLNPTGSVMRMIRLAGLERLIRIVKEDN